jgi:hypothetical protein
MRRFFVILLLTLSLSTPFLLKIRNQFANRGVHATGDQSVWNEYFEKQDAIESESVCRLMQVTGDVQWRSAGSVNWLPLGQRKKLSRGDSLYTPKGSSVQIFYTEGRTAVQLPEYSLFTVSQRPPLFNKVLRRFGVENTIKQILKPTKSNRENPKQKLAVARMRGKIPLDFPESGNIILTDSFPTSLRIRVSQEFSGSKFWAFVWPAENSQRPVWSGFSEGEFSGASIPSAGSYFVQVINDDETLFSDIVKIHVFQRQRESEKNETSGEKDPSKNKLKISALLQSLNKETTSSQTIFVE